MATVGFLDAKIKAKKTNKVMEWLDRKDEDEQEKIVAFGRKRAGVLRKMRRQNEIGVDVEIENRMKELAQARSMKSRKKADKEVKEACVFEPVMGNQRSRLRQMLEKDDDIVGAVFQHKWYDEELRKDCVWLARVVKISKKSEKVTVSYWSNED